MVAWHDNTLVVCEVKARRNTNLGDPFEAITPQKIAKLRRATAEYVARLRCDTPGLVVHNVRFDAAAVIGARVEVREAVF